ncbi:MAG: hypothetical protein ABI866_03390 [Dokdonella sp.]
MKSAPAIAFDYLPSRGLAIAIIGVTLLATIAVLLGGVGIAFELPIAISTLVFGTWSLRRHLKPNVVRIARGAGGWLLVDATGKEFPVTLVDSLRHGFLLVLGFRQDEGPIQRFVFAPDNCDADLRRRLVLTVASGKNPEPAKTVN